LLRSLQTESVGKAADGFGMRRLPEPTLQVRQAPHADAGLFRKHFLGQAGGYSVAA